MSEPDFKNIAIIGVGLIGGSFAGALKSRYGSSISIIGFGRREENLKEALRRGLIDTYTFSPEEAVKERDLIVLATPVGRFRELLRRFASHLKKDSVIIDVGSVKGIVRELESLVPEGVDFVGCHPIAGSEKAGAENASPELFNEALCIVTPTERTNSTVLNRVINIWQSVGCRVVQMSPEQHDRVFGLISHLPHLVSFALVNTVAKLDSEAIEYSGGGFKDTTRIAMSPSQLWVDISLENRENLIELIETMKTELDSLKDALISSDKQRLLKTFQKANNLRRRLKNDC